MAAAAQVVTDTGELLGLRDDVDRVDRRSVFVDDRCFERLDRPGDEVEPGDMAPKLQDGGGLSAVVVDFSLIFVDSPSS